MKPNKKDLKYLKKERKKSEDYKKGFTDGYSKALKDFNIIRKEVSKKFKPLKEIINKLKEFKK